MINEKYKPPGVFTNINGLRAFNSPDRPFSPSSPVVSHSWLAADASDNVSTEVTPISIICQDNFTGAGNNSSQVDDAIWLKRFNVQISTNPTYTIKTIVGNELRLGVIASAPSGLSRILYKIDLGRGYGEFDLETCIDSTNFPAMVNGNSRFEVVAGVSVIFSRHSSDPSNELKITVDTTVVSTWTQGDKPVVRIVRDVANLITVYIDGSPVWSGVNSTPLELCSLGSFQSNSGSSNPESFACFQYLTLDDGNGDPIYKASNAVAIFDSYGEANAEQVTASRQSLYFDRETIGYPILTTDGVDDFYDTNLSCTQPITVIGAINPKAAGTIFGDSGARIGINASGYIYADAGSIIAGSIDYRNTWIAFTAVINGIASKILIDDTIVASGDIGTGVITSAEIFRDGVTDYLESDLAELNLYNRALSTVDISQKIAQIKSKYGI